MKSALGLGVLLGVAMTACGSDSGEDSGGKTPNTQTQGCGLNTPFEGDEACLVPPHPSEGMQIHIGPSNYDDQRELDKFILQPGDDTNGCWTLHTPNTEEVFYQGWELSGRPGTHHIINTMYTIELEDTQDGFVRCEDPGSGTNPNILAPLPGASKPHMPRAPVAKENENVAAAIQPHTPMQADLHFFNATDKPILREFWLNLYFVPREQVEISPGIVRGFGGVSWLSDPIPAYTHDTYRYSCPLTSDGRIIMLLGHTHSHAVRETAWIVRESGERLKVFEQYDYREPQVFYFDSISQNPDFSADQPGAYTGILEVFQGDALEWECEVNNDSNTALTYTNDVKNGEMCNIWGMGVGVTASCLL